MARTTASRRPFFPLLGEPLALDLVNTVLRRGPDTEAVDLISQPYRWGQLLDYQWPRLAPLAGVTLTDHLRSRECLHRVRELRDAARVVINAARLAQPGAPKRTNGAAGNAAGHAALIEASTGSITTNHHRDDGPGATASGTARHRGVAGGTRYGNDRTRRQRRRNADSPVPGPTLRSAVRAPAPRAALV